MIQVIKKAFNILELLSRQPEEPIRLCHIAEKTSLNQPTCARILQSLVECGYAEKVSPRTGYILGPMAYALPARGPYRKDMVTAAETAMTNLAQSIKETVILVVLYQGRRLVLKTIASDQAVRVKSYINYQYDNPLCSATGRTLLAYLPEEELKKIVGKEVNLQEVYPGIKTFTHLVETLKQIRNAGYTVRKTDNGIIGLGCPISEHGKVSAA